MKARWSVLLASLILAGCATERTKFLWRTQTTLYPNGVKVVEEGPDKAVLANMVGAATSIATMEPWGVLAGATTQIGDSVSRVVAIPADAVTTQTK